MLNKESFNQLIVTSHAKGLRVGESKGRKTDFAGQEAPACHLR